MTKLISICLVSACVAFSSLSFGCKKKADSTSSTETTQQSQTVATTSQKNSTSGKSGLATLIDRRKLTNDLKQVVLGYHLFWDSNSGRPPGKPEDLLPFIENNQRIFKLMKDGQIVVFWGATIQTMKEGTSNTILAYENDLDNQGTRLVGMADGSVKTMTKLDFDKSPKAGK